MKFTIFGDKENPFKKEYLQKLIEITPVDEEIKKFRNKYNPRRINYLKLETKYFDLYYPKDDDLAEEYANEINKYADTAYMFLVQMYNGIQVPVEIYLIYEEDAERLDSNGMRMLREGDIRKKELATFVYINDEHTKYKGHI